MTAAATETGTLPAAVAAAIAMEAHLVTLTQTPLRALLSTMPVAVAVEVTHVAAVAVAEAPATALGLAATILAASESLLGSVIG